MYPIIHLGFFSLPTYGTIIFFGFLVGVVVAMFTARKYNIDKLDIGLSSILAAVGLIVGAKLVFMFTVLPDLVKHLNIVKTHIPETIVYMFQGYVFYGGLLGALFAIYFYCRWFDIDFLKVANIFAPVIPLIHSFGRIGCFFGGCCYGIEYHGPLAIHFPENEYVDHLNDVPRFPVQLLESSINLLLFFALIYYGRKVRKKGSILGIYLICYSIIRFSLEFLRGDVERGILLGVSTSQWISLILLPIGIYLIIRKDKKISNKTDSSI